MSQPIKSISSNTSILTVEMKSVKSDVASTGTTWTCKLVGHYATWETAKATTYARGASSSLLPPCGIPSGFYLEDYSENIIVTPSSITGSGSNPGWVEVELKYVNQDNLSDGAGSESGSEPTVYERDNIETELPLENHPLYSEKLSYEVGDGTYYDYVIAWKNAGTVEEKKAITDTIATLGTGDGQTAFNAILLKYKKGIESAPYSMPVLTKTTTRNSAPAYGNINKKENPTGFGSLKPSGHEWVKKTDRVSRTGRTGSYVQVEQWHGAPTGFFDSDLYPTA